MGLDLLQQRLHGPHRVVVHEVGPGEPLGEVPFVGVCLQRSLQRLDGPAGVSCIEQACRLGAGAVHIGAARVATHPDRTAIQSFDLWITDVRVLNKVMKEIERVKGVLSVERIRA